MAEVQDVSHDSGHLEWETPLFNQAITQFEQALLHAACYDADTRWPYQDAAPFDPRSHGALLVR